ncbi:MAG: type II toxin-antitoxin system RelE/ParE family toxin [Spirochaetes bacterium]|nr:type II toxin-antitoxin system RelE/ParE family toxin [Spirochaetota bacterium]
MSDFRVFETNEFFQKLGKLLKDHARFIRSKLDEYVYPQLKKEPFFGPNIRKLRDYTPAMWRYRIGRFRLFYTVDTNENMVYILSVDFHRESYK